MQITFMEKEANFMLLNGLPDTPQWIVFCSLTISLYNSVNAAATTTSPSTTTSPASSKVTFNQVATLFTTETNHWCGQLKKAHPGSEYMNTASATPDQKRTYPTTGVYMHKHNSKGVPCRNPVCVVLL
jgi:hypothetical protein